MTNEQLEASLLETQQQIRDLHTLGAWLSKLTHELTTQITRLADRVEALELARVFASQQAAWIFKSNGEAIIPLAIRASREGAWSGNWLLCVGPFFVRNDDIRCWRHRRPGETDEQVLARWWGPTGK